MKKCTKCNKSKEFKYFSKKKGTKYQSWCKKCHSSYEKEYRKNNPDKAKRNNKIQRERIKQMKWDNIPSELTCSVCKIKKSTECFGSDVFKKYHKETRCKECKRAMDNKRNSCSKRKKTRNEASKKYHSSERGLKKARIRNNLKYKNNKSYAISKRMSSVINECLRDTPQRKQGRHWEDLVEYSLEELMEHLENLFLKGMSWDNRNEWHIDHIIPRSAFNIKCAGDEEFQKCWTLENLRPLWAKDNISKKDKLISFN